MKFAIGDIHGELSKLTTLLTAIEQVDKDADFIFVGDYLDKGEDPYATLAFLSELSQQCKCIFLRGNHEYYWELLKSKTDDYATYLLKYGGKNTIHSVHPGCSLMEAKEKLFSDFGPFFQQLQNFYLGEHFLITHSGLPPDAFSSDLKTLPTEKFLFNRYPFFRTEKFFDGKRIIFGHTGFYTPYYDGYKIGIDTAACYLPEQPLTAFCMDENFFINSSNQITQLTAIDTSVCPVIPRVKTWRQI
jgi:serine/threonine protein phosphatase 1